MKLNPRYDGQPLITLDGPLGDPAVPLLRQRRRLGEALEGLDADAWEAPTRCERWSVKDVVIHLNGTNQFWLMSIASGLDGAPTRFLDGFDPVATPAQMVDAQRSLDRTAVLEEYLAGVESMAGLVADLDGDAWAAIAEAPPGHLALRAVVAHALWDGWIHERDILVPAGVEPVEEVDEVALSLRYAAALGPAFGLTTGMGRRGTLGVECVTRDGGVDRFRIDVGDGVVVSDATVEQGTALLRGSAVDLVDGLSLRTELHHDLDGADQWLVAGLDEAFEQAG